MNVNPNNKECMKIGSQKYPKEDGGFTARFSLV
jgi:hypothetical protein